MIEVQGFPNRILIVDDNDRTREALRARVALTSPSYIVATAQSGAEALARLGERGFDVVLCDLKLQAEMDGIAVTRAVAERHPQVRVVVFSGKDEGKSKGEVLQAGAFAYLSKPINFDELLHAIQTVNSIRRTERLQSWFEILARISFDLQASFDFDRIARRIVTGVHELGYARARLYLLDEESQTLVGKEAWGMPEGFDFGQYRIPLNASPIIRRIFQFDHPVFCHLEAIVEQFGVAPTERWVDDLGLRDLTWIDCPLFVRSQRVGTLAVDNRGRPDYRYTEEDRQILGFFAGLAAQALNNSRLYAQEALANASLRSILREAPDAVITTDRDGTINFVSPSSEAVLGFAAGELLRRRAADFYTDEAGTAGVGRQVARELMQELRAGGSIANRRVYLRSRHGVPRPISLSISLLHDEQDEVIGTLGILKDLGPFEEQTRQYRDMLEGFGYGTLLLDREGAIVFVNRKAERLLRRSRQQLLETSLVDLVSPAQAPELEQGLERVSREGAEKTLDLALIHPDGGRLPVRAVLTPGRSDRAPGSVAVGLSDRSELDAIIQSGRLMALGQLVAGVAHEINNPLNHILLAAADLASDLGSPPGDLAAQRDYLAMIQRNGGRIHDIVEQLREFARSSDFERRPSSVNAVISASAAFFTTRLRSNDVDLELDLAPDLPAVYADVGRLQQVIVNLIVNAEEAMAGQQEAKRIRIASGTDGGRVFITVADTGPGIPEEIRASIFDPFFTTKPPNQGTGLGLSISKSILDLHQGTIQVEDRGGRGTTFRIELPGMRPGAGEDAS